MCSRPSDGGVRYAGTFSARLEEAPGWVVYVTVVAVQALILVPLAMTRVLDTDEGMYALAAKLVAHGRVPYEDFWFQYTPLYAYAYGLWSRVAGESWYSLRMLSALLAILIGVLLYRHVSERLASRWFGLLAVLLYASAAPVFQWNTTIKTYALLTLFLFIAYVVVASADRVDQSAPSQRRWLVAGGLVGTAVGVRLFFAAVVPAFLLYVWLSGRERGRRMRNTASLSGGLCLGLAPRRTSSLRSAPLLVGHALFASGAK